MIKYQLIPVVFCLSSVCIGAEGLSATPSTVMFRMVERGPVAPTQTISIMAGDSAPAAWTATASSDAPWIQLSAGSGTTPAALKVSLVAWRAVTTVPGSYSGRVIVASGGETVSVNVTMVIVAHLGGPTFTYLSGPDGCTNPGGYPDPALCTVADERPPGNFQPPGLGESYVDQNFGATVRIMSGLKVFHTYSANNPLSARNKYLMTFAADGSLTVVDPISGGPLFSGVPGNQDFFWDSDDDSVYYYPKGSAFIRHDLVSGAEKVLVDYATDGHKFTSIKRGGTTGSSKDNWISFFAPKEQQVCVVDLKLVRTYCAGYANAPGPPYGNIDYVLDAKGRDKATGKRYVILVSGGAAPGIYSVNEDAGRLDLEYRGPEDPDGNGNHDGVCDPGEKCMFPSHADTMEDYAGTQYLVFDTFTNTPCEVATSTFQLNKGLSIMQPVELGGGRHRVLSLWQCPFPNTNGGTDEHIGCAKKAPYCVISTIAPYRNATDPPVRFPHATEIIVMRDNGLEIRRLAESRSVRFREDGDFAYWAEPRAALSNDGSLVVADSNFGNIGGGRVTIIPTGFNAPQPAALNAASLVPALAPGAYATLFAPGLANCSMDVGVASLLATLCGARVTVNGTPAMLTYASPQQVNLLMPRSLHANEDAVISASVDGSSAPPFRATVAAANLKEAAPAIFSYAAADGTVRAVVQNSLYVLNGPDSPAKLGETQIIWANGLGPATVQVADGALTPVDALAETVRPVMVWVNGVKQAVRFSGLAPGLSGLYQVNAQLSPATPVFPEGGNFIWLSVDGVDSPQLPISIQ